MTILFYSLSLAINDYTIADMAWAFGFFICAWTSLLSGHTFHPRSAIITLLITFWALRFILHIGFKIKNQRKESFKYQEMRKKWGEKSDVISFTHLFLLQGLLVLIISLPLILINSSNQTPLTFLDLFGELLWLIGFFFETIGDVQFRIFKSKLKNKERIMTEGLWKFTRHPNYFGQVLLWWGIWLIALNLKNSMWTIVSPLSITFLFLFISKVSPVEEKFKKNKEYQKYKKRTSTFFPWFPKK